MNIVIEQFREGSRKVYQDIFENLYSILCSFANKYLFDNDESEDICQEVFIELWKQKEKFENYDQIKAFLYLSVKNKCLNVLKHQKVKDKFKTSDSSTDNDIYFEEQIIKAEVVSTIYQSINRLSKQRREIIILSMQGLKNNEIAENLNVSVNTIKLQKKIAYQKLREELKHSVFSLLL